MCTSVGIQQGGVLSRGGKSRVVASMPTDLSQILEGFRAAQNLLLLYVYIQQGRRNNQLRISMGESALIALTSILRRDLKM